MDDLISRRQAIGALHNYLVGKNVPCDGTLTCRLIENEVINKLPSAQPKRGKWILHTYLPHHNYCSICEKDSPYNKRWNFCPNCGADMRGERNE